MPAEHRYEILNTNFGRRLSAAVMLIDDFTGKPVTPGDIKITAKEVQEEPLHKSDGYYLFLNYRGKILTITVKSKFYVEQTVEVSCEELPPLRPVVLIRLIPNSRYAFPLHTTCLEGKTKPGGIIRAICKNNPHPLKLISDYSLSDKQSINLYNPNNIDLEGRTFALYRKGGRKPEYFTIKEPQDDEKVRFLMSAPLKKGCKKAGAVIFPVIISQADETGTFFMLIPKMNVKIYQCIVQLQNEDGSWTEQNIELEPGKITKMHENIS